MGTWGRLWRRVAFLSALGMFAHLAGLEGRSRADNFQFNWLAQSPGVSASGSQWATFPAGAYTNCGQLEATVTNPQVSRFERATDQVIPCVCPGPNCFPIKVGDAYLVQVSTNLSPIVSGTDASAMLSLKAPGPGSASGNNAIGLPRSVTGNSLFRASDLMNSIGLPDVVHVQRFLRMSDAFETYTGRKGTPSADFTLEDGVGYFVRMNTTKYWGSSTGVGCGTGCVCFIGIWAASLTPQQMGQIVCALPQWGGTGYTCTPTSTGFLVKGTGLCNTYKKLVTITTSGSTTTAPHLFGYRLCCNSPLTNEIGIDGEPEQSIDDTSITVGELTISSETLEGTVPASNPWTIGLLAACLLLGGVYLLTRWSM